jgi:hypothetical protein
MSVLGYLASGVLIGWGAAHLAPTRAVALSFGDITPDNRRGPGDRRIDGGNWVAHCRHLVQGLPLRAQQRRRAPRRGELPVEAR